MTSEGAAHGGKDQEVTVTLATSTKEAGFETPYRTAETLPGSRVGVL